MSKAIIGTALITGASGGIGAIYADRLARRGYDLILVARTAERLEENAARIRAQTGRTVDVIVADLADPAAVSGVSERLERDPAISLLVNNAGITLNGGMFDNAPEALERLIAVNVTAPTLLAAAAGRAFADRKTGTIINIGSVVTFIPETFEGVYSSSKAYILNLSLSLAAKLKDADVRVQAVLPGATRTEIWTRSGHDVDSLLPGKVMDAEDLVDAALVGLDKGELVTIPPLEDDGLWDTLDAARLALGPHLSQRDVAARYRPTASAA
ncbi:SDR family NAD(P)-dependent oxidoreductase [Aquabacter sp. CN5-332]|uniref:SDR family NAD(P)-dependent oxidoreductase n=1 Tax=Aquabacter sp. CN5-332 TaxID=3156608 RepID=UPI0032B4EA1B